MNIENFKETISNPDKERELTEEEKAKISEFYIKKGEQDFKTYIADIKAYVNKYNISVDEAISEVTNKTSKLSASRRIFLISISPEVWNKWIPKNN